MSKIKNYAVALCAGIGFLVMPMSAFLKALSGNTADFDAGAIFGLAIFIALFGAIIGIVLSESSNE
jgi:hypothetical protein